MNKINIIIKLIIKLIILTNSIRFQSFYNCVVCIHLEL